MISEENPRGKESKHLVKEDLTELREKNKSIYVVVVEMLQKNMDISQAIEDLSNDQVRGR